MGCATCGQRYRGRTSTPSPNAAIRRARIAARRTALRNERRGITTVIEPKQQVVVQPDTPSGVVVERTEIPVDPTTGIALSVIKDGVEPSTQFLGDTEVKPISVVQGSGQGD